MSLEKTNSKNPQGLPTIPNAKPNRIQRCAIEDTPEGQLVTILVDPDIVDRIRKRAGPMELRRYYWENIFKIALNTHVY